MQIQYIFSVEIPCRSARRPKSQSHHRNGAHKIVCRHIQRPSHQFVHPTAFALELEDQAGSEYDSDPEPAQRSFSPVVDHRIPVIDHRTSLYSGSKSHRGVLTDQSAQNRQQRRLESASHCTGSAILKPKFHQTDTMAKGHR